MAQAIIRSVIDFKRDPWPIVSDSAKDLVRKMLEPDPKRRLSAAQVLGRLLFLAALSFPTDMLKLYTHKEKFYLQNILGY